MSTITSLPDEVILIILRYISIEDVVSFTSTCKKFQHILSKNNKFWEKKFYQRCFTARRKYKYNAEGRQRIFFCLDFKKLIKKSFECIKKLQYYVFLMFDNDLTKYNKAELEHLLYSIAKHSLTYYFVLDELNRILSINQSDSNLTNIYNFGLLHHSLIKYRITYKLNKFLEMPKEKQHLEKLFTIMAQYFRPHISYSVIKTWLNDIAQTILHRLRNKYPNNSILSTSSEQLSFWRDNNVYENFWSSTEVEQIILILEEFIFSDLNYQDLLIALDLIEDKYIKGISEVLRRYLLTITFHSVARRLGIHCTILGFHNPEIIMIFWNLNYNTERFEYTKYLFMKEESTFRYPLNIKKGTYDYAEHFGFPLRNNVCINRYLRVKEILKLTEMIMFSFEKSVQHNKYHMWILSFLESLKYLQYKIKYNIKLKIESKYITETIKTTSDKEEESKRRKESIKFAVGMIVKCPFWCSYIEKISYPRGVIVGWHFQCDYMFKDKLFETFMFPYLREVYYHDICQCETGFENFDQPHYIILTEDNKINYVPQDCIRKCSPKLINNIEIGRYFCTFEGTYYVPNKSLAKEYPEDIAALLKILSNQ